MILKASDHDGPVFDPQRERHLYVVAFYDRFWKTGSTAMAWTILFVLFRVFVNHFLIAMTMP